MTQQNAPAPGWYQEPGSGRQRWWDGNAWQMYAPDPQQPVPTTYAGRTANRMPVSYTRAQKGHSITAWVLISMVTGGIGLIWLIYYSVSPNHYWHA